MAGKPVCAQWSLPYASLSVCTIYCATLSTYYFVLYPTCLVEAPLQQIQYSVLEDKDKEDGEEEEVGEQHLLQEVDQEKGGVAQPE